MVKILLKKKEETEDIPPPKYMTEGSSGMDLFAANKEDIILKRGDSKLIPLGISLAIPQGYEAQIRPRSGLALKYKVTILNTPATIDSDYRGEVGVILINLGESDFIVKRGMRIAQMVIQKVEKACFEKVERLSETERGKGGFGHTKI